jgi:Condensation domain
VFNYVGRLDAAPSGQLTVLDVAPGTLHDPAGAQPHRLAVEVAVVGDRLRSTVTSAGSVDPDEVAVVTATYLQALRMLGLVGRYPPAGPSVLDFPVADMTSDELNAVRAAVPDLVDVYPLTPMQEGLLFHTSYDADADPYVNQFFWTIDGPLDHAALASAWAATCARHAVLRTGVWTAAHRAHQVVHARGQPMTVADDGAGWPDLRAAERAAVRGGGSAPLVRLAVLRVDHDSHRVVWTHHHLLFDGWCTGPVLGDLFTAYDAVRRGQPPTVGFGPVPRPFRDYVRWLDDEDVDVSAGFWRARLAGAVSTCLPPEPRAAVVEPADGEGIVRHVFAADAAEHVARAQRSGTTLNTIALAGWAIALLPECGDDLVVGNTVSGRSVDLDPPPTGGGAEDIVGLLINTVPARVRVDPATGLRAWLAAVQADAMAAREHEHVPMTAIRRWVAIDPAGPLFDTAVVVENLPDTSLLRQAPPGLAVRDVGSRVRNHYTLTLRVVPQAPLAVEALFDPSRTTHARATDLLTRAARAMIAVAQLAGTPRATVGQALAAAGATPEADRLAATGRQT